MSELIRFRGDDYPILASIKVDGEAIDLTGSVVTFSYKNSDEAVKSIVGSQTSNLGEVEFIPLSGVDFQKVGVFAFDIQRVGNGFTYTHLKGTLIIDDDVT
jgi:hypothetical protein